MDIFSILTLIGGLAIFLYGMDMMGDSLKKLAGSKLESFLASLTSTKTRGFILGLIVTAIIQSSSATSVMLVGFVNSGIMKLAQTISILMGANIGTTVTAWILSLTGIDGSNLFLKLLKPDSFTPILALIGVIMIMASSSDKKKNIGSIMIGFSLIIFGMDMMSSLDADAFSDILIKFSNPIMAILIGTIITAILQSSSASVGILQALSLTCVIPYSIAIPIILGQNIGTTITPILSAITGNTQSKRVAAAALYIKIIGVVVVAVAFYILDAIFNFPIMDQNVTIVSIAIVHTLFNILSTVILIPFTEQIVWLTKKTIKRKPGEADDEVDIFATLDDRFLSMPSFAVEKCRELVLEMSEITKQSILKGTSLLYKYNKADYKELDDTEGVIDRYEDKTSSYLAKIASRDLSTKDSLEVSRLLHVIGDVERISDHSVNIANVAKEMYEKNIKFSEQASEDIKIITDAVNEIITVTIDALKNDDFELAKKVEPLDGVIDKLKYKIKDNHIQRLRDGGCTVELGFILSDLLITYERVAGHCSNIAVSLLEPEIETLETHDYFKHIKSDGDTEYVEEYQRYKKKYALTSGKK